MVFAFLFRVMLWIDLIGHLPSFHKALRAVRGSEQTLLQGLLCKNGKDYVRIQYMQE